MVGSLFSFFAQEDMTYCREKVLDLLELYGVKLDPHPELFSILTDKGVQVDKNTGMVKFPKTVMEKFIEQAPKQLRLGAQGQDKILEIPRQDGTFYARTATGAHGWIDPDAHNYRKVMIKDLAEWGKLINSLDEINFIPFLFSNDVPVQTADVHGLSTLLRNSDKHVWVQPYSTASIEYLLRLGGAVAGGAQALKDNPVISMIACSLTPRAFKTMDLEIILQSARARVPIHACSLPGSGGTAPATLPGTIILATAEILAMLGMAQAVEPGTPVVACPIIFSTDMRTGRSLQSSVESLKCASGAVQFIKAAFNLPTHNYGSGSDSPCEDGQGMSERAVLSTLMGLSGLDILGGAGQLEVATAVSPLQLIVDNEVIGMIRQVKKGLTFDDENMAWDVLVETNPGDHFLTSPHTVRHCRDAFAPQNFTRMTREAWEREGSKDILDRCLIQYHSIMKQENPFKLNDDSAKAITEIVESADKNLVN